jgi:hypothetical protein
MKINVNRGILSIDPLQIVHTYMRAANALDQLKRDCIIRNGGGNIAHKSQSLV